MSLDDSDKLVKYYEPPEIISKLYHMLLIFSIYFNLSFELEQQTSHFFWLRKLIFSWTKIQTLESQAKSDYSSDWAKLNWFVFFNLT